MFSISPIAKSKRLFSNVTTVYVSVVVFSSTLTKHVSYKSLPSSSVARILAIPSPTAVNVPFELTVTTSVSLDSNVIDE